MPPFINARRVWSASLPGKSVEVRELSGPAGLHYAVYVEGDGYGCEYPCTTYAEADDIARYWDQLMPTIVQPGRVKARHKKVRVVLSVAQAIDLAKHVVHGPMTYGPCHEDCGPQELFRTLESLGYTVLQDQEVPLLTSLLTNNPWAPE